MTKMKTPLRQTDSRFELLASERGRTWLTTCEITVTSRYGMKLTIPAGFKHDRYTFAPDFPDELPAIAHDFAYVHRKWNDGSLITLCQADDLLYYLMTKSKDKTTRRWSLFYYIGVRLGGRFVWFARKKLKVDSGNW